MKLSLRVSSERISGPSARIAKRALKEGMSVREIIISEGLMSEKQVNEVLHVDNLTKPNIR